MWAQQMWGGASHLCIQAGIIGGIVQQLPAATTAAGAGVRAAASGAVAAAPAPAAGVAASARVVHASGTTLQDMNADRQLAPVFGKHPTHRPCNFEAFVADVTRQLLVRAS
jgi:hypothetical protein